MNTTFHDRDGEIWMDGEFVDWRAAQVHVLTHALHYGSAVFEGLRAYSGALFELEAHTDRLFKSAEILDMTIPYSRDDINRACEQLLARSGLKDAYFRPLVWRGSETMGVAAQKTKIHVAIAAWQWPAYFARELREKGLRLTLSRWRRPAPNTAPVTAKASGLYMICTLSKHEAEAKGYQDALMLDHTGKVAEATGANIFFVKGNTLYTPPTDCILDGITRRTVISFAKSQGIEVVVRPIELEELADFEQAVLTGTAAEVSPIGEIGDYRFEVGALTRMLMDKYDHLVREKGSAAA